MEARFTRDGQGGSQIEFFGRGYQPIPQLEQRIEKKIRELETILVRFGGHDSTVMVHLDLHGRQEKWYAEQDAKVNEIKDRRRQELLNEARYRKNYGLTLTPEQYEAMAQEGEI